MAKVAIYVEDPGAANFVAGLVPALAAQGTPPQLFADGAGAGQLAALGLTPAPGEGAAAALADADALLVGVCENRRTIGHELVDQARRDGIVVFGAIDGPSPTAARMFSGEGDNPLAHAPDWLLVPDAITRRDFVAIGFGNERIVEVGHPHYDRVLRKRDALERQGRAALRRRCFPDLAHDRPILVFLAELSDGLDPAAFHRSPDYTLAGWGDDDRRTHVVLQEVLDALDGVAARPQLVLRLHPKNEAAEFTRYAERIDRVSADEPAMEVVFAADMVVGLSTMLLAEAALLGRPVLSVLPRAIEREWLPAVVGPQLPWACDRAGVRAAMARLVAGQGGRLDIDISGLAGVGERAARAILDIVERRAQASRDGIGRAVGGLGRAGVRQQAW